MTPNLQARIALVMAAIRLQRDAGLIEPQEPVSYRRMERISYQIGEPVGREEFARAEHKARLAARALLALRSIQSQSQP
jgi:hypothetical protein